MAILSNIPAFILPGIALLVPTAHTNTNERILIKEPHSLCVWRGKGGGVGKLRRPEPRKYLPGRGMKGGRNCVNWENLIEKRKIFAALTDIFS